ncbi:antibiotic biosynthesis monooxygenase [Kribbella sp. NPDC026611]|uniref:antibiotic biosynthesis monooxygenase family protein n=1 Tax=Kribbella sp. NPDC026611 TaxID=3154911 RepID=UPI0033CBD097
MIVRIWRTGIVEERAAEYDAFAHTRSLPMFRRQPGCRGVYFTHTETGRAVVTIWTNQEAADALAHSDDYLATVAAIEATGFLLGPQSVELLNVNDHWQPDT